MGAKLDFRMLLDDLVTVMPIHNRVVPYDNRCKHNPFINNVFFKLGKLVLCQRRTFSLEFRVNSQFWIHCETSVLVFCFLLDLSSHYTLGNNFGFLDINSQKMFFNNTALCISYAESCSLTFQWTFFEDFLTMLKLLLCALQ